MRWTHSRCQRRLPLGYSPSARGHPSPRPDGESMTGRTEGIARTNKPASDCAGPAGAEATSHAPEVNDQPGAWDVFVRQIPVLPPSFRSQGEARA